MDMGLNSLEPSLMSNVTASWPQLILPPTPHPVGDSGPGPIFQTLVLSSRDQEKEWDCSEISKGEKSGSHSGGGGAKKRQIKGVRRKD